MANFSKAVEQVLIHEGGFVDHPMDKGGATNWGITQKTYENYVGRSVTTDEIRNMPRGNAVEIYKTQYWDKVSGDNISNYGVAFAIFDQAVNRGISSASKQAQRVLGIYPDGIIGKETIARLNAYDAKTFITQYVDMSKAFYQSLVDRNPSQIVFLKGWMHRADSLLEYSMKNAVTVSLSLLVTGLGAIATFLIIQKRKI